jgi:hypothetical protein
MTPTIHQLTFRLDTMHLAQGFSSRCAVCALHFRDALDVEAVACLTPVRSPETRSTRRDFGETRLSSTSLPIGARSPAHHPPIRSDAALEFLGELQVARLRRLCVPCAALELRVNDWAVLKMIRETVLAGDVTCLYTDCSRCRQVQLVAALRALDCSPR